MISLSRDLPRPPNQIALSLITNSTVIDNPVRLGGHRVVVVAI